LLLFSPKYFVFPPHILKNLKIKIYKTVILPVVLYGCETWSVTLGDEHRLRVFENRVLRRIFGPKREEDGSWRKLHNGELHRLHSSPNIVSVIKSRRMGWAEHVARMGKGRGVYRNGKETAVHIRKFMELYLHLHTSSAKWCLSKVITVLPFSLKENDRD
jgi:hypothetical protein